MQHDNFGALDENLLAALDEMLSFEFTTTIDALVTEDVMADFNAMQQLDNPLWEDKNTTFDEITTFDENVTLDTKAGAAKPSTLHRPGSGSEKSPTLSLKSKDAQRAPYSRKQIGKRCRRKRPKDELKCLRAKVADMEEELQLLQTKPSAQSRSAISTAASGCSHKGVLKWKRIAEQQKKEAGRVVAENWRLRAMLTGQMNATRAAIDQHQRDAFLSFVEMAASY